MQTQTPSSSAVLSVVDQASRPSVVIPADRLFQGKQEVVISHNGTHYRLRITKNTKLILTK